MNAKFSENGQHVTFSDQKFYYFSQSMSTGSEEDKIVIPNLPMFGAFRKLGSEMQKGVLGTSRYVGQGPDIEWGMKL